MCPTKVGNPLGRSWYPDVMSLGLCSFPCWAPIAFHTPASPLCLSPCIRNRGVSGKSTIPCARSSVRGAVKLLQSFFLWPRPTVCHFFKWFVAGINIACTTFWKLRRFWSCPCNTFGSAMACLVCIVTPSIGGSQP